MLFHFFLYISFITYSYWFKNAYTNTRKDRTCGRSCFSRNILILLILPRQISSGYRYGWPRSWTKVENYYRCYVYMYYTQCHFADRADVACATNWWFDVVPSRVIFWTELSCLRKSYSNKSKLLLGWSHITTKIIRSSS